jgi:hypothetical protein
LLSDTVISEKGGDPGFGRICVEETKMVLNPLEVREVPVVIEGGAPPGGTTGR